MARRTLCQLPMTSAIAICFYQFSLHVLSSAPNPCRDMSHTFCTIRECRQLLLESFHL